MDKPQNKYIAVSYKLYDISDGKTDLIEIAPADKPFQFISGFGIALPAFEEHVAGLEKESEFEFALTPSQAYGERVEDRVVNLERDIFTINGHFDHENIFEGAVVPLQNEDGNHFIAKVLEIKDDFVKMDMNHPLAGMTLRFKGKIIESREATADEIQGVINRLNGEDCGCGCGDHCGCDHDHCGCDHEHHHGGCGCGHCH